MACCNIPDCVESPLSLLPKMARVMVGRGGVAARRARVADKACSQGSCQGRCAVRKLPYGRIIREAIFGGASMGRPEGVARLPAVLAEGATVCNKRKRRECQCQEKRSVVSSRPSVHAKRNGKVWLMQDVGGLSLWALLSSPLKLTDDAQRARHSRTWSEWTARPLHV